MHRHSVPRHSEAFRDIWCFRQTLAPAAYLESPAVLGRISTHSTCSPGVARIPYNREFGKESQSACSSMTVSPELLSSSSDADKNLEKTCTVWRKLWQCESSSLEGDDSDEDSFFFFFFSLATCVCVCQGGLNSVCESGCMCSMVKKLTVESKRLCRRTIASTNGLPCIPVRLLQLGCLCSCDLQLLQLRDCRLGATQGTINWCIPNGFPADGPGLHPHQLASRGFDLLASP